MLQDLRSAWRGLRRAPAFALFAVVLLAVGTGASTAIFSVVDGVVLRPLPYPDPGRLVGVWETNPEKSLAHEPISPVNFVDYRALHQAFAGGAAWWTPVIDLTEPDHEPLRVATVETTGNLFAVLGVGATQGRTFDPDPPFDSHAREVVVSDRLWRTRFGADRDLVGRGIRLNGAIYTVVGVMPPGFSFPGETEIWQRLTWDPSQHSRGAHFMESLFRLAPGVSPDQADRELSALTTRLGGEFRGTNAGWGARTVRLDLETVGSYRPALFALLGASGLLLLITCFNLANLLLARAMTRETEIAVRAAIGAGRGRLVRQFAAESLLLAAAGAAAGLGVSVAIVRAVKAMPLTAIPRLASVSLDARGALFAVMATTLAAALFGTVPATALFAADPSQALRGARAAAAPRRRRLTVLAVAEVAVAAVLLAGAGLLLRSVANLAAIDTGVRTAGAQIVAVDLPYTYDWSRIPVFYRSLIDRIRERSGVTAAGATAFPPLAVGWRIPFRLEGRGAEQAADPPIAQHHVITPGYIAAVGATLVAGRDFTARDSADRPGVVIVNEALAHRYWPGADAVGARIVTTVDNIGPLGKNLVASRRCEIVGILRDVKNVSVAAPAEPALYFPLDQFAYRNVQVVVRGSLASREAQTLVGSALRALDPDLAVSRVRPLEDVLGAATDRPRMLMWIMIAFAICALVLAAVGLYGSLAYLVAQRRQELSVRAALGAAPLALVWLVLRQALVVAVGGTGAGILASFATGRALGAFLYGVRPADGATYVGVALVLLVMSGLAAAVPARRAALADPLSGLKAQ